MQKQVKRFTAINRKLSPIGNDRGMPCLEQKHIDQENDFNTTRLCAKRASE